MCGRKSSEIPFHTKRDIIKLNQAGNSQRKIASDLSISRTTVQSIIKKFKNTGSVENIGLRGRKPRRTIRDTNLLLRLVKSKRKITFKKLCSEFNHSRTQKFSQTTIRSYLRRTGFRRRVLKKNILIRPANPVAKSLELHSYCTTVPSALCGSCDILIPNVVLCLEIKT